MGAWFGVDGFDAESLPIAPFLGSMSGRDLAWKFAGLAGTTQDNPFLQKVL